MGLWLIIGLFTLLTLFQLWHSIRYHPDETTLEPIQHKYRHEEKHQPYQHHAKS